MINKKQPGSTTGGTQLERLRENRNSPDTRHKVLDNVHERQQSNVIRNTMPPPINPNRGGDSKDKR